MNGILALLSGPVTNLMNGAQAIIHQFVASPEDKLKAQQALLDMQTTLNKELIDADTAFVAAQASTVQAEIKSESVLARNWRPILMLTFTYIILHTYVLAPLFSFPAVQIPPDMWELIKLGMGGYVFGRTIEKITPDIAASIANKKDVNSK